MIVNINISQVYNIIAQLISSDILSDCYYDSGIKCS